MNSCFSALVSDACSTMVTMRAMIVSDGSTSILIRSAPVPLMVPANTSSPTDFETGTDSPVIEA